MLEVINEKIKTYQCDLIIFNYQRVDDDGIILYKSTNDGLDFCISDKKELYSKIYCSSEYNPLWRKAVKFELYTEHDYSKFYGLSLGEDLLGVAVGTFVATLYCFLFYAIYISTLVQKTYTLIGKTFIC